MADLVVIVGVSAFFAVAWAFVRGCDRIMGPDESDLLVDAPVADTVATTVTTSGSAR